MEDETALSPEDLSAILAPQTDADYENMPPGELAMTAVRNLPGSVWESAKGLAQAVTHPIDTAKAMGDVGYGLGSMAYGAMGGEQDPEEKKRNEVLARAVVEPYTSIAAFKKELAENPAGPLSMIIPGVGGTLVKSGEMLGKAGKIGNLVNKVGRGIEIVGAGVDPARAALEAGRAARTFGPRVLTNIQQHLTGSPDAVFEQAFQAGAARGLDGKAIRDGFNQFYNGQGDTVALSQDLENVVNTIRDNHSNQWIAERGNITGAATQPIDYSGVNAAFADAWKNYGGHPRGRTSAFPDERAALMDAYKLVREYTRYSPGTGKNNLAGLDELKRALWARAKNAPGGAGDAYKKVHAAVRQTLENTSPEYAKLMDEYQAFLDEIDTIKKTMGTGPGVNANAQLARAIRNFNNPGGIQILERVAEVDPTIPYKIAGAALNQSPTGLRQVVAGSAAMMPVIGNAIASGDPVQIAKVVPLFATGAAVTSPRVMGKSNYLAGRVAAGAGAMGDIPLGPVTVGDVVSGAAGAAYPAALGAEQIYHAKRRMQEGNMDLPMEDGSYLSIREPGPDEGGAGGTPVLLEDAHGNQYDKDGVLIPKRDGGRVARKAGGRIKGNPISAEVRKVRTLLSHKTATMLSMPDDAVATALHIAKGHT